VSGTLPGADVRGFYQALGIELPGWAQREASVGCFANPDAHAHGDRDPSCSVNVETGAWHCWGCGAKGGAFDAAIVRGLDSRQAFELKVAYGLAERDPERPTRTTPTPLRRELDQPLTRRNVWLRPATWLWTSSSSPRRAPGSLVWFGHRACCAQSTGGCGRALPCSSSAVAGSAATCSSPSGTATASCVAFCATRPRTIVRRRCSPRAGPGWGLSPNPAVELSTWVVLSTGRRT
jgi:hypothetical protein